MGELFNAAEGLWSSNVICCWTSFSFGMLFEGSDGNKRPSRSRSLEKGMNSYGEDWACARNFSLEVKCRSIVGSLGVVIEVFKLLIGLKDVYSNLNGMMKAS